MRQDNLFIIGMIIMLAGMFCNVKAATNYIRITSQEEASHHLNHLRPNSLIEICAPVSYNIKDTLVLPEKCVLKFSGGTLSTNNIKGNKTSIDAPLTQIFKTKDICGTWLVKASFPEWFGGQSSIEENEKLTDNSKAIELALKLQPSDICFVKGVYGISKPIVTKYSNINICGSAEIRALNEMSLTINQNGQNVNVNSMIVGDYTTEGTKEIFGLSTAKMIYGGGCINGDYKASVAIALNRCLRTIIKDVTIKNVNLYGFQASLDGKSAGNCFMQNCIFKNEDAWNNDKSSTHHPKAIAIYNNKSDCVYTNIEIVNFQTAVRHESYNGMFTNVHAWLRDDYYWQNSVTFDCFYPDITLTNCEADTMRRLIKCNCNNFHGNTYNCRSYNNTSVVSNNLASSFVPIIIDKNGFNNCQITINGGYYWFDTPYKMFSVTSSKDTDFKYISNTTKIIQ